MRSILLTLAVLICCNSWALPASWADSDVEHLRYFFKVADYIFDRGPETRDGDFVVQLPGWIERFDKDESLEYVCDLPTLKLTTRAKNGTFRWNLAKWKRPQKMMNLYRILSLPPISWDFLDGYCALISAPPAKRTLSDRGNRKVHRHRCMQETISWEAARQQFLGYIDHVCNREGY